MRLHWPRHDPDWRGVTPADVAALADAQAATDLPATAGPGGDAVRVVRCRFPASAACAGTRLLFFADLHWESADPRHSARFVDQVNALEPDWVLSGGDAVRHLDALPHLRSVLSGLRARRGKVSILGNWERRLDWIPDEFWRTFYENTGFRLLVNEVLVPSDAESPLFIGLDDPRLGQPDPECGVRAAALGRFTVGLLHSPEGAAGTTGRFLGHLLLAGHTHGGQWRIPGFGAFYTSTRYGKQFEYGWHRRDADGRWLYVTAGVGLTGFGLLHRRLFCPPEIVLLELTSPATAACSG